MRRRSLLPKAAATSGKWVADTIGAFLVTALVYRLLGESPFGYWATLIALRGVLVLVDQGMAFGVSRDTALAAAGETGATDRVRAAVRIHAIGGGVALLLGAGLAVAPELVTGADTPPGIGNAFAVLALEAALAVAASPLLGIARGHERFAAVASSALIQNLAAVLAVATCVERGSGADGLVVAAGALCGARVLGSMVLFARLRMAGLLGESSAKDSTRDDSGRSVANRSLPWRGVLGFAIPLWLAAVGTYLAQSADVPIVAACFGEVGAGHYALGFRLAGAAAGLLFAALSATFPGFVTLAPEDRGPRFRAVVMLGTALATSGFGCLMLSSGFVLRAWVGDAPPAALAVLFVYALVWLVNVPAHVISCLSIASDKHRLLAWVILGSAPVNFVASLVAARMGYFAGPAWMSLAVGIVTNWWLLPRLLLPKLGLRQTAWCAPALVGYVAGAVAVGLPALALGLDLESGAAAGGGAGHERVPAWQGAGSVALACLLSGLLLAPFLDLTVRRESWLRRRWSKQRPAG